LAGGDSDGDLEMLNRAGIRLNIARMDSPQYPELFANQVAEFPAALWLFQPTIVGAPVGFLPTQCEMADKTAGNPSLEAETGLSLTALQGTGRLGSFAAC
jgi:hypothetical protein